MTEITDKEIKELRKELEKENFTPMFAHSDAKSKETHIEFDWMEGDRTRKAVPTDARSSPFTETRNGVKYRVASPICTARGATVKLPAVPVDPRKRKAHKEWAKRHAIDPDY